MIHLLKTSTIHIYSDIGVEYGQETSNCIRYQLCLDWMIDRHLVDDEVMKEQFDEKLIIKILARKSPPLSLFNNEGF